MPEIPAEFKAKIEEWVEKRKTMPCPFQMPAYPTCAGCRFYAPAIQERRVDPKITVVGAKPPDKELIWQCEFDLMSAEISETHAQLTNFLNSIGAVRVRPR